MKKWVVVSICALLVLAMGGPALGSVEFSGQVATTLQSLESEKEGVSNSEEIGFGQARFNLQARADVATGVSAFAEVHNNPIIISLPDPFLRDENEIRLREAYLTLEDVLPSATLEVGRVDLKFGTQYRERTVNARAQDNPLIGNHLNDFGGPETGLHAYGTYELAELPLNWYAAVTNGTREVTVNEGRGFATTAAVGMDVFTGGWLKGSWHRVEHEEWDGEEEIQSSFAAAEGDPYLLESPLVSDLRFLRQFGVEAWQVDAGYDWPEENLHISGYVGGLDLQGLLGETKTDYWNVQGDWEFVSGTGIAARYSEIDFEDFVALLVVDGNSISVNLAQPVGYERIQVGLYHEYRENVLAKLEYVNQEAEELGTIINTEFNGVVGELSVSF